MSLSTYNKKRDFKKTSEPQGKTARSKGGNRYLIQKHEASNLHYDFRLELNGVLLSWAVPKGPSLSSADKRLAVKTEDHPLAYGDFEGTIPEGEYGGGTVMLWDEGTWEAEGDPVATLKKGKLDFTLNGKRLKGRWHLTLMRGERYGKSNWLMIKSHDKYEQENGSAVTEKYLVSVTTGRNMKEIAAGDKEWKAGKTKDKTSKTKTQKIKPFSFKAPAKSKKIAKLDFIPPQLATLHNDPPVGAQWLHEIKYDGYRIQLVKKDDEVKAFTRNGHDWSERFARLCMMVASLPCKNAVIDGELVVNTEKGISRFQLLQNALDANAQQDLTYYGFDLLVIDNTNLCPAPLVERKEILKNLVTAMPEQDKMLYSDHIIGNGPDVFKQSCGLSLEGIISKRSDSAYSSGRSKSWLKSKCLKRQEMVIGGFVKPKLASRGVGALLLGTYDKGELVFAGKVGTGFTDKSGTALRKKLDTLLQKKSGFQALPTAVKNGALYVKPVLVAEIEFTEWTSSGALRHPSFIALREDKSAKSVVREDAAPTAEEDTRESAAKRGRRRAAIKGKSSTIKNSSALNQETPPDMELTSPDKILYPGQGLTKLDLARYYHQVANWALPHLAGRPLSLVRCPEDRTKFCFFQRHTGKGTPASIKTVEVEKKGKTEPYLMIDSEEGLLSLVQMGALEIHPWGALSDDPDKPDRIIMDMDPDKGLPFARVKQAARDVRERLEALGLETFPENHRRQGPACGRTLGAPPELGNGKGIRQSDRAGHGSGQSRKISVKNE